MGKDNKNEEEKEKEGLGEVLGPWDFPVDTPAKDLVQGTMNLSGVSLEQWEIQELTQMVETSEGWSWKNLTIGIDMERGVNFSLERTPQLKRTCIIKLKKK